MKLTVAPITREFAASSLTWRYEPPYDVYNLVVTPENEAAGIAYFMNPENRFRQVALDGEPIAFFSVGRDGQVPGGDYTVDALDIGLGVRPDMTGRGLGAEIVGAVIAYVIEAEKPRALRVTIADFNARAQRVWTKHGFREVGRFTAAHNGAAFIVFIRLLVESRAKVV